MGDWDKEVLAAIESVAVSVENFFQDASEAVEDIAEQIHDEIIAEIDSFFQEFLDPLIEIYREDEDFSWDDFSDDTEFSINSKVEPDLDRHRACIGCRHYHGRIYGGNLLVCGMHPYGWDDQNCPDWEADNR